MNPGGRLPKSAYLTTSEAARTLSAALGRTVTPRTVSRWFDAGILRGFRLGTGRHRRIRRDSVEEYLRAHLDTSDTYRTIAETNEEVKPPET